MKKTCFVYWDPHPAHRDWAQAVSARFHPFVPFNSGFIKSHGILMHILAFLKALLFLPPADVYLLESPMMITAVLCRTLFSRRRKVLAINSDPFFWMLPRWNKITQWAFRTMIRRIDGYLSTSPMMDNYAASTGKQHAIVDLDVKPSFFKLSPDLSSKNACFIGPHINTKKGVDILIDVFASLPDQESRKLYLIGAVQEKEIQRKMQGKSNIIVTGKVPFSGLEACLEKCGLYLNLARLEPAGINILEAMAAGIPPIVSGMCGFSYVVRQISPRLVVPLDRQKIRDAILWLERSGRKKATGRKARQLARRFTKKNSLDDFQEKFRQLVNK